MKPSSKSKISLEKIIVIFHIFITSFCISIDSMAYSPANSFLAFNIISISDNNSNFTLVFFKDACQANLKGCLQGLIYKFLNTFFKSFQKHYYQN